MRNFQTAISKDGSRDEALIQVPAGLYGQRIISERHQTGKRASSHKTRVLGPILKRALLVSYLA